MIGILLRPGMPAVNGRSALRVEGAELFYTGPPQIPKSDQPNPIDDKERRPPRPEGDGDRPILVW